MKILVCSCDKDEDLFEPFHHCIEKYWPDHPEVIYLTNTVDNPYYPTIKKNYPLSQWTRGVREAVQEIDASYILLMVDDVFFTGITNSDEVLALEKNIPIDVASINLQVMSEQRRESGKYLGNNLWLMPEGSTYQTSVMCSLWGRKKLLDVFNVDKDPGQFELSNEGKGYKYCRLDHPILYWDGGEIGEWFGVVRGQGVTTAKEFLAKEGLDIDYDKRGFCK